MRGACFSTKLDTLLTVSSMLIDDAKALIGTIIAILLNPTVTGTWNIR
jgi:hypothetical protein